MHMSMGIILPVSMIYLVSSCVLFLKWWETKSLFHFRSLMGTYRLMAHVCCDVVMEHYFRHLVKCDFVWFLCHIMMLCSECQERDWALLMLYAQFTITVSSH